MSGPGSTDGSAGATRLEEAWGRVAEVVGGEFHRGVSGLVTAVQKRELHWTLTLERLHGESLIRTRLAAFFRNPGGFRFAVKDEGLFDRLWKTLVFPQDVRVGDAAFDRRFVVKGTSARRVRELMDERVRALLAAQPHVRIRVAGDLWGYAGGYARGSLQRDVDVLHFDEPGEIVDVERLAGLFDLFSELLRRLRPDLDSIDDDPERLRQLLREPGGRIERVHSPLVLWDGDRPRRHAATRLGLLGDVEAVPDLAEALEEEDDGLVAAAAKALGAIGDPNAVPALVILLGERERASGGRSLAEHAGEALERLGHAEHAAAFRRALEGKPEAVLPVAVDHGEEVAEALMRVVESHDFAARPHAARALGALGATEALPLLREKSGAWGMRTRLTEAARAAVEEIEARASLPRPASGGESSPDTHPRPAGEPEAPGATLPSPADREDPEDLR